MSDSQLTLHSFSLPVDRVTLSKAHGANGGDEEWLIEGLASTNSLDQQNEIVMVKGLDLSYLEQGRGTFNWNHRGDADPSSVVGVITSAQRTDNNELFIKGKLLKSLPKAKHVYALLKALETDMPERKMGMSIEGKVLARNGNQIVKAWVKAVALTLDPVNKDTWVSFAKSMDWTAMEEGGSEPLAVLPVTVLEEALTKALTTTSCGSEATPHGNSPLMTESLEKDEHDQGPEAHGKKKHKKGHHHGRSEKIRKSFTYDEAVTHLRSLNPALPESVAKKIVTFTFDRLGRGAS